ncbi:hypothetical protein Aperf_G00000018481 [Anoplocephala perfoliata]
MRGILFTFMVTVIILTSPGVVGLCGFGKVYYPNRHLQFPKSSIRIPDHATIGSQWVETVENGFKFDCAIHGEGLMQEGILEVSCCLMNSTDVKPWDIFNKRRLLQNIHEVFMEVGLT